MDIRSGRAVAGGLVGTAAMMGRIFSGSAAMAMGSLVGHLVYGVALGLIYGPVVVGHRERAFA